MLGSSTGLIWLASVVPVSADANRTVSHEHAIVLRELGNGDYPRSSPWLHLKASLCKLRVTGVRRCEAANDSRDCIRKR